MNLIPTITRGSMRLCVFAAWALTASAQKDSLKPAWVSREMQRPLPAFCDSVVRKEGKTVSPDRRRTMNTQRQGMAEPATYDYAPQPVVAGGRVYVGSSADEALWCLDAATGQRLWTVPAAGPVRFAPVVAGKDVFFCSDDGAVYCVDVTTGAVR